MAYKALYREYRPQTFDEVVGQKYIVQTLKNALNNGRIAHAYLFTGPRGTGKTTIAKLIAKGLNCTGEHKPCGVCPHCKSIAEGTYPDVIEIDAASNNSVDEVRDLIERVKYTPLDGKYKVYIIDEVHMMTSSAFNALLKTLEEPPAHAVFILATTEIQKVLPTIISRCQRFDFGRISEKDLETKIREVLDKEHINYEANVPSLVASLADGGVRDALGILDQTIAYAENNLTEQHVRDIYGVLSVEESIKFINLINDNKVIDCLNELENYDKKGVDLIRFTSTLIDIFKDLIVFNKTNQTSTFRKLNKRQAETMSISISSNKAFEYVDILMDALTSYKKVNSPRSYFELAILKMCNVIDDRDIRITYKEVQEVKENDHIKEEKVEEKVSEPVKENIVVEEETIDVKEEQPIVNEEQEINNIEEANEEDSNVEENPTEENKTELFQEEINEEQIGSDNNAEQVIDNNLVEEPSSSNEPVVLKDIEIDDNMILNFFLQCDRDNKILVSNVWQGVGKYLGKDKFKNAASKLLDTSVLTAGKNCIVLLTDYQAGADEINSFKNYFDCLDLVDELLANPHYILAISKERWDRMRIVYSERSKNGTLPQITPLEPFYDKDKVIAYFKQKEMDDPNIEKGIQIFGDLFKVED